jgi:hypothetical protein
MNRRGGILLLAWLAWVHSAFPSKGLEDWRAAGGAESLDECKKNAVTAASNLVERFRARDNPPGATYKLTGTVIDVTFASGETASHAFVCLPDTLDPRGPKGK